MATRPKATIKDLYHLPEDGKAEIVNGELLSMAPTGFLPGRAAGTIYLSLREYERSTQAGFAFPDNTGFNVELPHRESFSSDCAFYTGKPTGMKFPEGAPIFAAEVRNEGEYGPGAEQAITDKRADYFAAGTLVVWDVDLLSEEAVRVYRASEPNRPTVYRRGEVAEAEPALPGWSMPVDELFA